MKRIKKIESFVVIRNTNIGGVFINTIYVDLENCYGISKFSETFKFGNNEKAHLIYAPNGVMKTSFANTLKDICIGDDTQDYYYPNRNTIRIVKLNDANGSDLTGEDILVIESYAESYKADNESTLLANDVLKKTYDTIYKEINNKMGDVLKAIRSLSGKKDADTTMASDFGFSEKMIYDCLEEIYTKYQNYDEVDFSSIKYGKLFTTDAEKVLLDEDVVALLEEYMVQYDKLLSSSSVFKKVFNHNNANDVLNSLNKFGFFKANHKVLLDKSDIPLDEKLFDDQIRNERVRIVDEELASNFTKIDNLLTSKNGTKELRELLFSNRNLIPELLDTSSLKKKLWICYLKRDISIFQEAILNYQNNKLKLEAITNKAREQSTKWNDVVIRFNERFSNMPFKLYISNKEDVILKSELPAVAFRYKSRGEEVDVEEKELIAHLSNGEKKALYLLNIIFEIEARKKIGKKTFLIMDDIADSFDYRNKYAIIEYIKDIVDCDVFKTVILTHNFDFYRTVAGRVGIKPTSNFVIKEENKLSLTHGEYFENVFDKWKNKVYSQDTIFLSAIAFVRNLVEYTEGNGNFIYKNLTNLLHYKLNPSDGTVPTNSISVDDLIGWYETIWSRDKSKFCRDGQQKVIELLFKVADNFLVAKPNQIHIENKIVLSIAIRQKAEYYMINRINNPNSVSAITTDQTRKLRDSITFNKEDTQDRKREEIIEQVLIMTSENIHINSFMYEPIVDMSLDELLQLYKNVKNL